MGNTALYRHFDSDGQLLYVGISKSVLRRTHEHARLSGCSGDICSITAEWFESIDDAKRAERIAIQSESPAYNICLSTREESKPVETFGARIKSARLKTQVTQQQLADAIGVSMQAVSHWENNRVAILAENLLLVSGALGVSPYWLAFGNKTL